MTTDPFANRSAILAGLVEQARLQGNDIATLRALVEEASELGAARALARCGLQDRAAGEDIRELRTLLDAWRDARRTIFRTVVKWITAFIILGLLAGIAIRLKAPPFSG